MKVLVVQYQEYSSDIKLAAFHNEADALEWISQKVVEGPLQELIEDAEDQDVHNNLMEKHALLINHNTSVEDTYHVLFEVQDMNSEFWFVVDEVEVQ